MLSNEDYLNIFHEIKNSITLINSTLQLVAKAHPEVADYEYWSEAMSEIDFLKSMVTQFSSCPPMQSSEREAGQYLIPLCISLSALSTP